MKRKNGRVSNAFLAVGAFLISWYALRIAPFVHLGIVGIINHIYEATEGNPLKIKWCDDSLKTVLIMMAIYILAVLYYISTIKNRRRGEEYGSAKWADIRELKKRYSQNIVTDRILSENLSIGMEVYKHLRNLFTLVVGGSGAGKTRGYVIPNILQCNASMCVLDPKGESLRATGKILESKGYEIKVLDLIHMEKSHRYNPFHYIQGENDVQRVATMLFKATGNKEAKAQDPYWENAALEILMAFMLYLYYEAPVEEQNMGMVMDMVRLLSHNENEDDEENTVNPLEVLFMELKTRKPNHPALKYYEDFLGVPNKTLQTIKSTLTAKLSKFNLSELISLTSTDELDFESMGEKKVALFCVIPDMDSSFNFIVSVLYMQMFQRLAYIADNKYKGPLPVQVHFIMDEFANVALPEDFEHVISVLRSRNVSISILLQNMSQIKALFKETHESIVGNCDERIYLGGNEHSTHKEFSEMLGKETLDTNTYGKTHGLKGNYTTNDQQIGRELLTPDEIRMLKNDYCLVIIRGERACIDHKYNIKNHPLINQSPLGNIDIPGYTYGNVTRSNADIGFLGYMEPEGVDEDEIYVVDDKIAFEIITDDDIDF